MQGYIIRRILLILPTLWLVTLIVFFTVRLIPGDVVQLMIMQHGAEQAAGTDMELNEEAIREMLGLDLPMHVQYGRWLVGIFQGDLGKSLWTNRPVLPELLHRWPVTFQLGCMAMVIAMVIALPIGVLSAIRQDTVTDYIARSFAILCIALPGFWLATMVMVFPSVWWHWTPPLEYIPFSEDAAQNLMQLLPPACIMGMVMSGVTMRMTRTMMLEVLRQDYIRTAWSKGLKERVVILRHAMKNALIPVVTIIGLQMPILFGGTVIQETVFCLPGIGRLLIDTLSNRDYTMLSGINLFVASFVLVINLGVDVTYAYLDPRIHYT